MRLLQIANRLTQASDNLIDWSRTAEFLREGGHYNRHQLAVRGGMLLTTLLAAWCGHHFNQENQTHCSDMTATLMAGTVGLALAHLPVVVPLFQKRYQARAACRQLIAEIEKNTGSQPESTEQIRRILETDCATEHHAKASQTWGLRKGQLEAMRDQKDQDTPVQRPCLSN